MAVLPGVLGCRTLRRTVQVRLGTNTLRLPGGTPIFVLSRQRFMKYPGLETRVSPNVAYPRRGKRRQSAPNVSARRRLVPGQDKAEPRIGQEESSATRGYTQNPKTAARGGGHGLAV
ncbi:MAG: hypothetical protein V3W07_06420 [Syntrophobacteria bacterium]